MRPNSPPPSTGHSDLESERTNGPVPPVRRPSRRSTQSVTLGDVAVVAGVSQQTVSRAIRSHLLVSEATFEKVMSAIESTGYVPNLAASNLASNRSMTVAAIIPVVSVSIFADAIYELERVLAPEGYHLIIGSTDYDPTKEEELIRAFLGRRPDGFFIVGTSHTEAARRLLVNSKVPIVEAWDMNDHPIDYLVGYSDEAASSSILEHVVEKGYRRPTFAGSLPGNPRAMARQRGFESAMAGLLPAEPVRIVGSGSQSLGLDVGIDLLNATLDKHPETDVLMFSSDTFAAGALLECNRRGIRIPAQLAITGFSDFEIARHLVPSLTSVATPNHEIGRHAGNILLQSMGSTPADERILDLGFTVVSREST